MDGVAILASLLAVGVAAGLAMPLLVRRERARLDRFLPELRRAGGMTLDEIADALGVGAVRKGYLMQALDRMVAEGRLRKVPPPAGHPRLRVLRDTTYRVPGEDEAGE